MLKYATGKKRCSEKFLCICLAEDKGLQGFSRGIFSNGVHLLGVCRQAAMWTKRGRRKKCGERWRLERVKDVAEMREGTERRSEQVLTTKSCQNEYAHTLTLYISASLGRVFITYLNYHWAKNLSV